MTAVVGHTATEYELDDLRPEPAMSTRDPFARG